MLNIQWQNSENVKINNTNTSAIIEDASDVLNYFADKYIITKYPIKTGDLVEYAGITYIIVSQIDRNYEGRKEKQINYRARIRQADYIIKMVVDGKVEEFSTIIEGMKFDIVQSQIIDVSSDKIIATLKANDISNKIAKTMRFIKLGNAWKIVGIDKTKLGLITLFCDIDTISQNDDLENEIANINLIESPEEPEEPPIESELTYLYDYIPEYQGDPDNEVWYGSWNIYTIKKFGDGVEVTGSFTFELSDTSKASLSEITSNSCKVNADNSVTGNHSIKLIVTDVDTNKVAIEKSITIVGR